MFKLTSSNWKGSLLNSIAYSYHRPGERKLSKRGVDRYLRAKKKIDYERKQREKAEREALEALPKNRIPIQNIKPYLIPTDIVPEQYIFLQNSESFFDPEARNENIRQNIEKLEADYPLGLNDVSAFLGYRSSFQREHYNNILKSLLEGQPNTNERENKVISFMKLAQTLKLYNLFNKEHFTFFMKNRMSVALHSLLKMQEYSADNFFGPQEVIKLLKYVVATPDASFVLENIRYCSTIKEGLRPTSDSVPIETKLLYQIFDPQILKKIEVLPLSHSIMFLFPETFLKIVDLEGLFLNEILSVGLIDKIDQDIEYQKFADIKPTVFDENEVKINLIQTQLDEEEIHSDDENYQQRIDELMDLYGVDQRMFFETKNDSVKYWGSDKTPAQLFIEEAVERGKITEAEKERIENSLEIIQVEGEQYDSNQEPVFGNNKYNIDLYRFPRIESEIKKWKREELPKLNNPTREEENQALKEWLQAQLPKYQEEQNQLEIEKKKHAQDLRKKKKEAREQKQASVINAIMNLSPQELQQLDNKVNKTLIEIDQDFDSAVEQEMSKMTIEEAEQVEKQLEQLSKEPATQNNQNQSEIKLSDSYNPTSQQLLNQNEQVFNENDENETDSIIEENILGLPPKQPAVVPGNLLLNQSLKKVLQKYTSQNPDVLNFIAEVFFNSPNFEHGLKSVLLAYLILSRLTYFIEQTVPENEMKISDLLSLASHEYYEGFFTDRFLSILQNHKVGREKNVALIFSKLLNRYDAADQVTFKPIIFTRLDREFYSQNKVIFYGKSLESTIQYESNPESYLTIGQTFETEQNQISCRNKGQTVDIVDCYNNSVIKPGYTHETIDLLKNVLSQNSEGMFKTFKKSINEHPTLKYQLSERLEEYKNKKLNKEQLSLLGLNEMTDLLYSVSAPLVGEQMLVAVSKKEVLQDSYIDALNQINMQSLDFVSPDFTNVGHKLRLALVEPYNEEFDEINKSYIKMQQKQRGTYTKPRYIKSEQQQKQKLMRQAQEFSQLNDKEGDQYIENIIAEQYKQDNLILSNESELEEDETIIINEEEVEGEVEQVEKEHLKPIGKASSNQLPPLNKKKQFNEYSRDNQRYNQRDNQRGKKERSGESRYVERDSSILDIIQKKQKNTEKRDFRDDADENTLLTSEGGQSKHQKRAAHEARKHYKRKDTEPNLTDKERKQQQPFRRDKQRDDEFPTKRRFSTMKPRFEFSTFNKKESSIAKQINSATNLEEACVQIKNIFRRNNNAETLKELIEIPSLNHFKNGNQCLLAIFFYQQGYSLAESSSLEGSFEASMGDISVDYNKYLKNTVFDFQLGDHAYIKLLEYLKVNFNRGMFKKVLAHIIRYSNGISLQFANELSSFVTAVNVPLTHLQFINLIYKNDIGISLSTLMILLGPIANFTQTSKDVYTIYRNFVQKKSWENSIMPLQNYITKLVNGGQEEYLTFIAEDMRSIVLSKKMKAIDKSASSEQSKRLQQEFKDQLKKQELQYVLSASNVFGFSGFFDKAESLFDQFKTETPQLNKEEIKIGILAYTRNPDKLHELFEMVKNNKFFITPDVFNRFLQPIKKNSRNKLLLDRILEVFVYSGIIQKSLTVSDIHSIIETFTRTKNTNSYPRFLEHILKYELKLDENSYKLFYNVIKDAHTTQDSKEVIVNLLDIIFNRHRETERENYRLNREREDQKKKKLAEMRELELQKIKQNLEELERSGIEVKKPEGKTQATVNTAQPNNKPSENTPVPEVSADSKALKKQEPKSKKKDKKSKDDDKMNKILKKDDDKSKRKLVEESTKIRKEIVAQNIRLNLTPNQMRRGGRQKFLYLAVTEEQMQSDVAAKEAMSRKRRN